MHHSPSPSTGAAAVSFLQASRSRTSPTINTSSSLHPPSSAISSSAAATTTAIHSSTVSNTTGLPPHSSAIPHPGSPPPPYNRQNNSSSPNTVPMRSPLMSAPPFTSQSRFYGNNTESSASSPSSTSPRVHRHPKKDVNAPEKWKSAYQMFRDDLNRELADRNLDFVEMSKLHSEKWANLTPERRKWYEDRAKEAKDEYDRQMNIYRQTESYKQYQKYLDHFYAQEDTVGRVGRPKGRKNMPNMQVPNSVSPTDHHRRRGSSSGEFSGMVRGVGGPMPTPSSALPGGQLYPQHPPTPQYHHQSQPHYRQHSHGGAVVHHQEQQHQQPHPYSYQQQPPPQYSQQYHYHHHHHLSESEGNSSVSAPSPQLSKTPTSPPPRLPAAYSPMPLPQERSGDDEGSTATTNSSSKY
ncbi:hypothetical protein H4219_004352 [Mycoemilia scoparia]|uniref:HMG box domain-containing protein n=1 Tax=Mycoemilia scoparia TaxID=417184 RepID=A0A9W7ZWH0_9FUNG|nr:hypothetical protein H4219_004352 [Mycoemilia scoparia]